MNQREAMQVFQCHEHLPCDSLNPAQREVWGVAVLTVELRELIEVLTEELGDDYEVLLEVKVIDEPQATLLINVFSIGTDNPQKLDLIKRLVQDILFVVEDLHAYQLVGLQVEAFHRVRKGSASKVFQHLETRGHDAIDLDRELLGFLKTSPAALEDYTEVERIIHRAIQFNRVERVPRVWVSTCRAFARLHRALRKIGRAKSWSILSVSTESRAGRRCCCQNSRHPPFHCHLPRRAGMSHSICQ
mmetsp:Transcript_144225/g.401904  ORF Transcript_144225/g.401904 Transcript_144225/m.401904 type:complete len:245 (-) Transcript_144225:928-1662(-)